MLTTLRHNRQMTQATLAQRAGVTQGTISLIETGARCCSVEVLQRLSDALDLTAQERADLLAWAAARSAERNAA